MQDLPRGEAGRRLRGPGWVRVHGAAGGRLAGMGRRAQAARAGALGCRRVWHAQNAARSEQVCFRAASRNAANQTSPVQRRLLPSHACLRARLPTPAAPQVQRNCVVLPCLHFLYCDSCFKRHCATSPSCPACNCAVTGFQALIMHR